MSACVYGFALGLANLNEPVKAGVKERNGEDVKLYDLKQQQQSEFVVVVLTAYIKSHLFQVPEAVSHEVTFNKCKEKLSLKK